MTSTFPIVFLMTVPCTIDHSEPGAPDEYGNHPPATITTTNELCWLAQSSRGEEEIVEFERWNIYLPPTVVLDANDIIHVGTATYYVQGNPWKVIDPLTTATTHIEATVVRRV